MDKEDIKLHLAGYRPELYDDDDPQIAEALAAAKADPELSQWLDEQIAFDRDFAASLTGLTPRDEARDSLLGGPDEASSARSGFPRWPLAAAALFLVCSIAGVKYFLFPPEVQFAHTETKTATTFRQDMAMFANQRFMLDERFKDLGDSQRWLEEQEHPAFEQVPSQLVRYKGLGCKTIDWAGTKVGLICFKNSRDETVHLFIVEKSALAGFETGAPTLGKVATHHGLETGGWVEGDTLMLLVGAKPGVRVGELL